MTPALLCCTQSPIDTPCALVLDGGMATRGSQRPFNVAYYARNRAQEIERVRVRQAAMLSYVQAVKEQPCSDCGGGFAPYQMDFDHRDPSSKAFTISRAIGRLKSRSQLDAEIAKCDVVCANCHRLRTNVQLATGVLKAGFQRKDDTPTDAVRRERADFLELRARQTEILDRIRDVPCIDCGQYFGKDVMEFDHREPAAKTALVPQMTGRVGTNKLLAEVAKCDVVCANCHRERTHRQRLARLTQLEQCRASSPDVARPDPVSRSAIQLRLIEDPSVRYAA